jgi:hypothetical protein
VNSTARGATLDERVTALERAMAANVAPDAFSPSAGQVIDAKGKVTYEFDGHIHAEGIDFVAAEDASPDPAEMIRWLRTLDGAAVADLTGFSDVGGRNSLTSKASSAAGVGFQQSELHVHASPHGVRADTGVTIDVAPSDIIGEHFSRTVIDGEAASSFVQLGVAPSAVYMSPPVSVDVAGLAAHANSGAAYSASWALPDGDGPLGFGVPLIAVFSEGGNAAPYMSVDSISVNDATDYRLVFRAHNGLTVATGAAVMVVLLLSDKRAL